MNSARDHIPALDHDDRITRAEASARVRAPIDPRLMRVSAAAEYLSLGAKALRKLISEGKLPFVQLHGKNSPFLLDRRDLDRFIDSHKIGA